MILYIPLHVSSVSAHEQITLCRKMMSSSPSVLCNAAQYSIVTAFVFRYSLRASCPVGAAERLTVTIKIIVSAVLPLGYHLDRMIKTTIWFYIHFSYPGLCQNQTVWSLQKAMPRLFCCRCWQKLCQHWASHWHTELCWCPVWKRLTPGRTRWRWLFSGHHPLHWDREKQRRKHFRLLIWCQAITKQAHNNNNDNILVFIYRVFFTQISISGSKLVDTMSDG